MPYKKCPECEADVWYDGVPKFDTKFYDMVYKVQERILSLQQTLIQQKGLDESIRDKNLINVLEGQINVLKFAIEGVKEST